MDGSELWQLKPIGYMKSVFHFKNGTPRQPAVCSHAKGSVTVDKLIFNNPEHSLEGLDQFSHVWIVFLFHKNNNVHSKAKVKPPRLDGRRVGVFSTRSPYRPNAIGLTLAAIDKIEDATVYLKGVDILDGTPILDIKPYIPEYDAPPDLVGAQAPSGVGDIEQGTSVDVHAPSGVGNIEHGAGVDVHAPSGVGDIKQEASAGAHAPSGAGVIEQGVGVELDNTMEQCKDDVRNWQQDGCVGNTGFTSEADTINKVFTKENNDFLLLKSEQKCDENQMLNKINSENTDERKVVEQTDIQHKAENLQGEATPVGLSPSLPDSKDTEKHIESHSGVKPHKEIKTPKWINHSPVQKLDVRFTPTATEQLDRFSSADDFHTLDLFNSVSEVRSAIQEVLNEDPRSVYRRTKCKDSLYFFNIDNVHVTAWFDDTVAEVVRIQPVALVPQCSVGALSTN